MQVSKTLIALAVAAFAATSVMAADAVPAAATPAAPATVAAPATAAAPTKSVTKKVHKAKAKKLVATPAVKAPAAE